MSRKKKFDLSSLVHHGDLKEGDMLAFVSDPSITCQVVRHPNGEYKVNADEQTMTIHAFAMKCLGQEPPDHATKWLKAPSGKTLFEIWHQDEDLDLAA